MQSILRSLLVFAVLVLVTANSGFYNGNYCAQHSDCKVDEFCNNNSACECLPNMVLNPISKNCSQIACDPEFKSCPGSASCVRNVCTKYCDMEANNCRPSIIYDYYQREEYRIAFYAVSAVGSLIVFISAAVCCYCARKNKLKPIECDNTDHPLIGQESIHGNSSKVYSFFLCFTSQPPLH